jgi:hypothetical protein
MAQSLPGLAMSEMAGMAMEECAGREVAGHFGLDPPAADIERMQEAGALDAKNKTRRFEADSARRQAEATEEVRRAARQWVTPWYEQLEQLRGQGLR